MAGSRVSKNRSSRSSASSRASAKKRAASKDHDDDTSEVGRANSASDGPPTSPAPGRPHNAPLGSPPAPLAGSTPEGTPDGSSPGRPLQENPNPNPNPNAPQNPSPVPSSSSLGPPVQLPLAPAPLQPNYTHPGNFGPQFWNGLTKVFLTRRARFALDIQNTDRPRPVFTPPAIRPRSLERFAMHGGPDLRHLRNYTRDGQIRSSRDLRWTGHDYHSPTHENLKSFEENWQQHLEDHNIYMQGEDIHAPEPSNIGVIRDYLATPLPGFTEEEFGTAAYNAFVTGFLGMWGREVITEVIPEIANDNDAPMRRGLRFDNLEPLTTTRPDGRPDVIPAPCGFDGVAAKEIDDVFRADLERLIVPTAGPDALALPNLVVEAYGTNKATELIEKRRATYHGAVGARAMQQMQSYVERDEVFDGNAYAFSVTYMYMPRCLTIYAHHMMAPTTEGGRPSYHMTKVCEHYIGWSPQRFIRGATAFRRVRLLAGRFRDDLVERVEGLGAVGDGQGG